MLLRKSNIAYCNGVGIRDRFATKVADPFPPVADQTLETVNGVSAREMFDADRTSGSLGIFTAVSGTAKGGLTRGPKTTAHPTRRSGALVFPTTAEVAAGTDLFRGEIVASACSGGLTSIHWGCWYRPQEGRQGAIQGGNPDNPSILSYRPYTGVGADYWIANIVAIFDAATRKIILQFYGGDGVVSGDSPVSIDPNQWIYLALVVIVTGGGSPRTYNAKAWYKTLTGSPTVFGILTNGSSPYSASVNKVYCEQRLIAGHGGATGRIGALSLYKLSGADPMAAGLLYPTDIAPPIEERKSFSMDTTATGTALEGPFKTPAELDTAKRNCVFLPVNVPWRTSDTTIIAASTFTFTTLNTTKGDETVAGTYSNLSRRLGDAYRSDSSYLTPQGDILSIAAGDYYFTSATEEDFGFIYGIDIKAADSANKPTFYIDRLYTGGWITNGPTWAVGVNDGWLDYAAVWQGDGSGGWLPLYGIRVHDSTIGETAVNVIAGSYWSGNASSGTIYLNPVGGIDPNTVPWRITPSWLVAVDTADGFVVSDGRIKDIKFRGGQHGRIDSESLNLYTHWFAIGADADYGYVAIFDGLEGKEYGKHAFGFGAQNTTRAVVINKGTLTTSGPMTPIAVGGVILTATATNPSVITTTAGHGLATGYAVVITGALGNTSINGTWTATVTSSITFTVPVLGNGVYAGSGVVYCPIGFSNFGWDADALHSGAADRSADHDGIISLIYDCVDRPNISVVGSITPIYNAAYFSLVIHNTSGNAGKQMAYVAMFGNDFTASQDSYLSGNGVVQQYDVGT